MVSLGEGTLNCNDSCCQMSSGNVVCFGDYNFTDRANITYPEQWELALRWTYASIIMLVAVFGNLTIIIILAKNRILLRHSINCFILNMSVADLITALAGPIPFTIRDTAYFWVLGRAWCHLEGYIQMLVMMVSVTSLATISFDRMIGVVWPFHTHLKMWQCFAIIVIIWIVSAILAVPFGIYRIYTVHQWQDLTEITCGEDAQKIQVWWMVNMIGLTWLPLLIMLSCYTTILVYFRSSGFRSRTNSEHPSITLMKRRVVIMMFVIVIAFTVFWLPFQILKICGNQMFFGEDGQIKSPEAQKSYDILYTMCHYLIYTNVAVNPIIYALMHQTFRRALRVTFPCLYHHKSAFVLTPGLGRQHYVWSMRSTSNVYSDVMAMSRQNPEERRRRMRASSAVVGSAAVAASIVIETNSENQRGNSSERSGQPETTVVQNETEDWRPNGGRPLADERYVRDLRPREISIVSTGALGQLITQVIEEESSSDVEVLVMLVSLESLATISCDRMMGVVRPFHTHLKTWQSLAIIIIIWVSSAVLAVPWGLYRVYTVHIWKDRTETNCGEKETLYMWWMALVGLAWLSLAIMLVSYFTILVYFRHPSFKNFSKREHPVMTHLKKRVVKMMFLVVVTFVVCWLPIQLLNIFHTNFLNDFGSLKDDTSKRNYAALMTVSQYMIYVNPAVNPVIYGLLHQNFRRAFRLTFPCIFTRKSTLVLTRGQGVTRYMWSVKSTGSQPSVTGQRRHCGERQVQPERNPATPSRRLSGSETLNDEAQRNSHVSSEGERKRRKKCCILKPGRLARQKSKKKDRWSPENDNDERCCSAGSSYANEKYVRDLPQKISIVSKGALGHLITEVIEEETSSDAERERVL